MEKWVMTVFNSYQWDLNYTNPEVFLEMLTNLVKLTDLGVDVVRFDALAFLWKKIGTISQNLPEAHNLISLFPYVPAGGSPRLHFTGRGHCSPNQHYQVFRGR
jgi:glycosidase